MSHPRLFLSPPHLGERERALVAEAFDSNWIAPVGPHLTAFEAEFGQATGLPHAVAVSSGTAALHLALLVCGVGPGDLVLCSDLTFIGSVNPVLYVGAEPHFIDSEETSWNLDPRLFRQTVEDLVRRGRRPKAAVVVDLYGQCADWDPLLECCREHGIIPIEDAAEALGATYRGRPAGHFGRVSIFSFNGNKIITTSNGGMLTSADPTLVARARHLATQAREPAPHYQHQDIGYNYRLSNLLAGLGRGQLTLLEDRVRRRRAVFAGYRQRLADLPGLGFMPEPDFSRCTRWLTCLTIDPAATSATPERLRLALEAGNIESRPLWKPMHLQPVFAHRPCTGGRVGETLFARGLCLPSGSALTEADLDRVCGIIRAHW